MSDDPSAVPRPGSRSAAGCGSARRRRWAGVLIAAGLVVEGAVLANPWGLPADPGGRPAAPDVYPEPPPGPDGALDAPAPVDPGYRFRGDPPNRGAAGPREAADGRYRFRPLSERERGRQEQARGWRPAAPGTGQGRPPGPWPVR